MKIKAKIKILNRILTPSRLSGAIVAGQLLAAVPASGALVSYYNFDASTNNDLVDSNDGQVNNQTGYSASTPDGSAMSLDLTGTGAGQDYVRLGPASPNGPDFNIASTNSFTISMWVNYTASERGVVSIRQDLTGGGGDRSGITFGIDGSNAPFVGMIVSSANDAANGGTTFRDVTTNQTVPTSTWTHMAATYDGGTDILAVYVGGAAATMFTSSTAGSPANDGSNATGGVGAFDFVDPNGSFTGFGASGNAPSHSSSAGDFTRLFYDGLLDDVSIWDEALGATEVGRLASGESPLTVPEPTTPLLVLTALGLVALRRRR